MLSLRCSVPALALAAALVVRPAAAEDAPPPLERDLLVVEIGAPREFRLVRIHPLHVPATTPAPKALRLHPAGEFADLRRIGDELVATVPEGSPTTLLAPGRIALGPEEDFALAVHTLLRPGEDVELQLARASDDGKRREPRLSDSFLPPALRWHALDEPRDTEVRETAQTWTREADAGTERSSPLDLQRTDLLRHVTAEYRLGLGRLPAAPTERRSAGWAVFVNGALAGIELTTDRASLERLWRNALAGISAEAAYAELSAELLDEEVVLPANATAERLEVARVLEELARSERAGRPLGADGTRIELHSPHGLLHAVEWRDALAHLVLVTDPAERDAPGIDDVEPGPTTRIGPTTGEDERVLERR